MVATLVAALLVATPAQQSDTATFRDGQTAELFARARVRHIRQDSLVRDYAARVQTRIDMTAGRSRFARLTTLFAHETVASVAWQRPNDLKVNIEGSRTAAPALRLLPLDGRADRDHLEADLNRESMFDRPWFIPRSLGDSIRLMGVPEVAALHPLADDAQDNYRYAIVDSVFLGVPGRPVRAIKMRVTPKSLGPAMVAGDMWLDAETADVIRMMVVFLGQYLWDEPEGDTPEDSASAREDNKWANRFVTVEAEIEYALIDRLYWMPDRQILLLTIEIPWFINSAFPIRAVTRFREYRVNGNAGLGFRFPTDEEIPDDETVERLRNGEPIDGGRPGRESRQAEGYYRTGAWSEGRWEVEVPPADSLAAYPWEAPFEVEVKGEEERRLRESLAALAELEEDLPRQWLGRPRAVLAWERFSDLFRYNRVQGPSVGAGYLFRPGIHFTTIFVAGRFGFADLRPTGEFRWRRDGPGGRFDLTGYYALRGAEPWTSGQGIGNSLNALFVGNDDADYYRVLGGAVRHTWHTGPFRDVEFGVSYERHRSADVEAGSVIADLWGDGDFQPNPPVLENGFVRVSAERPGKLGPLAWRVGSDALLSDAASAARFWGSVKVPFAMFGRTGTLGFRGGAVRGNDMPQLLARVGGPQTVRGHLYGAKVGREFWAAQFDMALTRNPIVAPVVFADVGDTFHSRPLVGVGGGLSFLNGVVRLNLSKGLNPGTDLRFDLLFQAPR
jgi:hypothetical protein